jgi:hypothetical protein
VCRFVDDRLSDPERRAFVHKLLQREQVQDLAVGHVVPTQ